MSTLRVLCQDHPKRSLALLASDFVLIFESSSPERSVSQSRQRAETPRCLVEFHSRSSVDLAGYKVLGDGYGTLGLATLSEDVFLCVVSSSSRSATIRPGETVSQIKNVEFCRCCICSDELTVYLTGRARDRLREPFRI